MTECVFCEIYKEKEKIIYEDSYCFVVLDKYPISRGHLLIISKEHFESMLDATDEVVADMYIVAKKFAKKQEEKLGAVAVNIGTNIGKEAGQKIMHFHIHVIPRYPKGGRSFDFGHNAELNRETEKELVLKLK
jgi:histidine triad (HIT) family protein